VVSAFHRRESKRPPRRLKIAPKWVRGCGAKNTLGVRAKIDFVLIPFRYGTMAAHDEDLPFRVELWDDKDRRIEEIVALA
jgi:hypothetical protein